MDDSIHILHLEDDAADAELVQAVLESAGMTCQVARVQTHDEFGQAVRQGGHDVILADYSLPTYDGVSALRLALEQCPDVPFIFVSGTMGEDAAIEGLTQGATDYVLKQKLSRLAPAIKRALHEAENWKERKRAEEALRESEDRFRRLAENAQDVIYRYSLMPTLHLEYINPAVKKMLGYSPEEFYADPLLFVKILHPDDQRLLEAAMRGAAGLEQLSVLRSVHKDGSLVWTEQRHIPIFGPGGDLRFIEGIARDITARKQAEDALRRANETLRATLEAAPVAIFDLDTEGRVKNLWNAAAEQLLGWRRDEVLGHFLPSVPEESQDEFARFRELIRSGKSIVGKDLVRQRKDGSRIEYSLYTAPEYDDDGQVSGNIAVLVDITERKRAEEQHRLQTTALEAAANAIVITDRDGNIQWANPAFTTLTCYVVEEALGRNPRFLKSGQQDQAFYSKLWNTILAGQVWHGEVVNRRKDSNLYVEEMTIAPVRDAHGEIGHFVAIKQDITERKRAEEQIRELNQRLERRARELDSLNRAGQVMTSTLDLNAVLRLVMDEITRLLDTEGASVLLQEGEELVFAACAGPGAEKLSGARMPATSGIAGWVMREEKAVLVSDPRNDLRFYDRIDAATGLTTRSMAAVPLVVKGVPRGVIEAINKADGVFDEHDLALLEGIASSAAIAIENARLFAAVDKELTERDRAEAEVRKLNQHLEVALQQEHKTRAQLIQAGKLSAMGRMVASVAHEFNNPLQTIKNCLFLIQQDLVPGAQGIKFLDMAASEVQRLSDLVSQLRAVYRPGTADQMQAIELSKILDQVHSLVTPHLTKNRVRWEYTELPHLLTVSGIPDQLKQVFLNLSLNASDAMQMEGGTLTVSILSAADGRQVGVAFRDAGPGIDPRDLPNLFDPFFTTKESGMGLGLAICYDIVQKHGGRIEVESQPGQGATFTVWLPLASP
jgi:PAS domain S-box-containing protein